jgi:hypothetical protein
MQHFRVKFFARPTPPGFDLGQAIPVFHRWIQKNSLPETMIDVADYQHVAAGPGILLVSHDAYYGLDQSKHRLGLLYTRRTAMEGSIADRVKDALTSARRACDLLEKEPEFAGKLSFDRSNFEVSVNDRMMAPNTEASFLELEPELHAALGPGKYELTPVGSPSELLTVKVTSAG